MKTSIRKNKKFKQFLIEHIKDEVKSVLPTIYINECISDDKFLKEEIEYTEKKLSYLKSLDDSIEQAEMLYILENMKQSNNEY